MARLARIVIPDLPHHLTQRGNRGLPTFFGEDDYVAYLQLLSAHARAAEVAIRAYCLMPNQVHLLAVPSTTDGLRAMLGETHRRYTRRINLREGWQGHLWQERFASFPLDEPHLWSAARYIEQNPVRAGLVETAGDWPWSSARAHLQGQDDDVVTVGPLLERYEAWADYLGQVEVTEEEHLRSHERTGRPLGDAEFVARLEGLTGRRLAKRKPGPRAKGG